MVFVDDMGVSYNHSTIMSWLLSKLQEKIEIKNYGLVKKIIKIEVPRNKTKIMITLHQSKYIKQTTTWVTEDE